MAAIAPMDLVKSEPEPSTIPLLCSLCPRTPKFSDVSHLLTHISSKTHLSNRFQTELKSKQDVHAKQRLDTFDRWYADNGIEQLLQARMTAKDQKKGVKRPRHSQSTVKLESSIDFNDSLVKSEPGVADCDVRPSLHHWNTIPLEDGFHLHGLGQSVYGHMDLEEPPKAIGRGRKKKRTAGGSDPLERYWDGNPPAYPDYEYHTPDTRRTRSHGALADSPEPMFRPKLEGSRSGTETTESGVRSEMGKEGIGQGKLKGVFWPGMAWFDSAPEEKKKMRNQRKDASVLKQMEETSASIEPMEQIWDMDGELQRIRDVYASSSVDGSPERKSAERNKQKQRRARRVPATQTRGRKAAATKAATRPKRVTRASTAANRARNATKVEPEAESAAEEVDEDATEDDGKAPDPVCPSLRTDPDVFKYRANASNGRSESPVDKAAFEFRDRPALHSLDPNQNIASPLPTAFKPRPLSFLSQPINSFSTHPPTHSYHDYLGGQHGIAHTSSPQPLGQPSTLNPLWINRGHPYTFVRTFMPPSFSTELNDLRSSAGTANAFLSVNTPNGLSYHSFNSMNNSGDHDGADATGTEHY